VNPTQIRKEVLSKEIARVQKSIHRLVDAYQEGLLSLEELRRRVPDLKKREAALTSELQTLEASVVDQQKCLQLVENLEQFLSRLQKSADTLEVIERQKILRLVVKEILVGPDTVTIKHSIPSSGSSGPCGTPQVPSYLLRKGSQLSASVEHRTR
jgi:site-specific DNA recombinase